MFWFYLDPKISFFFLEGGVYLVITSIYSKICRSALFIYFYNIKSFPPSEYLKWFMFEMHTHEINETTQKINK